MSIFKNIEDGIKKGFRIQYELGRLSAIRLQHSSGEVAETETMTIAKIDKRIANFESEMDKLKDFFGFDEK